MRSAISDQFVIASREPFGEDRGAASFSHVDHGNRILCAMLAKRVQHGVSHESKGFGSSSSFSVQVKDTGAELVFVPTLFPVKMRDRSIFEVISNLQKLHWDEIECRIFG